MNRHFPFWEGENGRGKKKKQKGNKEGTKE